jgi:hypothetical protein
MTVQGGDYTLFLVQWQVEVDCRKEGKSDGVGDEQTSGREGSKMRALSVGSFSSDEGKNLVFAIILGTHMCVLQSRRCNRSHLLFRDAKQKTLDPPRMLGATTRE